MILKKCNFTIIFLLTCFLSIAQTKYGYNAPQKQVTCRNAAVVSAHPLASMAGLAMLKKGGNAFDAAIATQFALAVVYPNAGNLGGGGFMVAHLKNGKNIALDFRETAPSRASKDMYLDSAGNSIKGLTMEGRLASGIPGTVAGLFATLKYARLDLKTLIAPSILLAEKGFALTSAQADSLNATKEKFLRNNRHKTAFVKEGGWKAGDLLVQKDLAGTLKRIRDHGAKGFYEGITAKCIVEEMKQGKGIISLDDLANYKAKERSTLEFDYKGVHVVTMSLPSSGGILLQQMMKMIEKREIASLGFQTTAGIQLMVEAERRAFADRANFLGNPDFVKVPVRTLLSDAYLQQRMSDFIPGKAGNSDSTKAGIVHESEQTTHISIIDREGNAVAITTTLNDNFGCKTVVKGAGFILNNEMDDFSIKAGTPNMFGVTGNEANAIAPNKRMLSSMTPTLVLKNGVPCIVVGTKGGSTIPTSIFQSLVNILEFGLTPSDAVNKPKFHHQWLPDRIDVETNFPTQVMASLTEMGYKVKIRETIGRTELIQINNSPKRSITAVADSRGDDDAQGY